MKKSKNKTVGIGYLITSIVLCVLFIVWSILVSFNVFEKVNDVVHTFVLGCYSEVSNWIFNKITFFGCTLWIVSLAAVIFVIFLIKKKYGHAFTTASILIISTIINNVVKWIVREPRPAYMTVNETSLAYPSGHTMASATLYGFFIYLIVRTNIPNKYKWFYGVLLSILALAVMTSRIYLGAHYFNDIFGGVLASSSLIFLYVYLDKSKNIIEKIDNKLNKKVK